MHRKRSCTIVLVFAAILAACQTTSRTQTPQSVASRGLHDSLEPAMNGSVDPVGVRARSSAFQEALDRAVAGNHGFGGGVLRVESTAGDVIWEGASGRLSAGGPPMTPSDAFEIASVTKTLVAVAVLRLGEESAIELDAPIGRYLPAALTRGILKLQGRDYGPKMTVRQLLGHRGGLPDYWTDPPFVTGKDRENAFLIDFLRDVDRFWTPRELVAFLPRLTPIARPGRRYHYSDSGYVLLGLLVEQVTGRPLHEHIRQTLLDPLGMSGTHWSNYEHPPQQALISHRYEGQLDLHGQRRQTADWGGGGLVSTARDLGVFTRALMSGRLFRDPATMAAMQEWQPTGEAGIDYGLGLFRVTLDAGRGELRGHDGHGNAFMFTWPERGLSWIGTLNQTENSWWDMVEPLFAKAPR